MTAKVFPGINRRASTTSRAASMIDEQIIFSLPFTPYSNDSYDDMVRRARTICQPFNTPAAPYAPPSAATTASHSPLSSPMEGKIDAILQTYNFEATRSPQDIRNFVTNRLLYMAAEGKNESTIMKSLEMLGKTKDVALFEERSVVLVENMTTEQIQEQLRRFANRLRGEVTTIPENQIKDIT